MKSCKEIERSVCLICANCIEIRSRFCCYCRNENFGNIHSNENCKDFQCEIDEEDDDNDDGSGNFDPKKSIECPQCRSNAYWEGSNYVCEQCSWCGFPHES